MTARARTKARTRRIAAAAAMLLMAPAAMADPAARGEQMAKELCADCHLNPGQGEKSGPGSVPGFHAVARRPGQTLEGIMAWLRAVPPMMPNHHLSQDEMEALALYILSLAEARSQ